MNLVLGLHRCPKCGGFTEVWTNNLNGMKFVQCNKCGLRGSEGYNPREAINNWNLMFKKVKEEHKMSKPKRPCDRCSEDRKNCNGIHQSLRSPAEHLRNLGYVYCPFCGRNLKQPITQNLTKGFIPTIVFDFDGVINPYYAGWKGYENIPDPPVDGIGGVINRLRDMGWKVIVSSTRADSYKGTIAIWEYLHHYGIQVDEVTNTKPIAMIYVDDRAIKFDKNRVGGLLQEILSFKTWLEKEREEQEGQ